MPRPVETFIGHLFSFNEAETTGDRWFFRVFELIVVFEASAFAWQWARYVGQLTGVADPVGVAHYVDLSFLFHDGGAQGAAVLVAGLCVAGFLCRRARGAYLLALVVLHVLYVARFSLGKVGHGSCLLGMCLLALGLGVVFSSDPSTQRGVAIGLARFSIGFSYVLGACSKLVGTGLSWPSGRHLWMWMIERGTDMLALSGTYAPSLMQRFLLNHVGWSTVLLTFGLVAEALGWLYWFRKTRGYVTLALVGMHVGIALTMHIRFDLNVGLLILLGFPWGRMFDRIPLIPHAGA